MALLLWFGRPGARLLWGDEVIYWDAARRLAAGQPLALDPLWPPLYPHFLTTLGRGDPAPVQWLQLALLAAAAVLLHDITRRLTGSFVAGTIAALLLLADPQVTAFATYYWPEALHLFLLLAAAWMLVARRGDIRWAVPFGVALGLALLAKNLLGPFVPVFLAAWFVSGRRALASTVALTVASTVIATLALGLVVAPTMLDNKRRHDAYFIGDSAAFNVLVGLRDTERRNFVNDQAGVELGRYVASAPTHRERIAILWQRIDALIVERGPAAVLTDQLRRQYFRLFDRESFFTDQLPGGIVFAQGGGYRDMPAWLATAWRASATAIYAGVLLAAPFGALVWWQRSPGSLAIAGAYVAYVLGICLVIHVKTRYRVQLLPVLYLSSAAALASPSSVLAFTTRRCAAAAVTATALLLLAFGGPWLP